MSDLFSIPEQGYVGLKLISALSDERYQALAEALKGYQPSVFHSLALANLISDSAQIEFNQAKEIRETIGGLALVYWKISPKVDDFWDVFFEEIALTGKQHGLDDEDSERLQGRLPALIEHEGLALSVVSASTMSDLPNSFSQVDSFVDLRPVFFPESDEVKGFVVFSSLKLTSFDGTEYIDKTISLDEIDVDTLIVELENIKSRFASIKSVIRQLDTPLIPISEARRDE
ncbi:hypothetical protein M0D68_14440 [Paraburkholderia sp. SEWSISQ10-3 4]|uniref:hypothetical protein n=1 Tax=Paraburkholderia TaxID=1822464 RepID=UPI00224DDB84|nr:MULTISPECIES: hypothetical protein [Paraburkholderia]MCX4139391.1 hypothetical protein [Paraburkholderia aspalathi]MDN7172078.1 hypothetical protein [Paraburkholderia sp. SEWSISQ10-3 4]MDQ6501717.1 hypothetical protein [Paraburkholderia aspalathi]